MPLNSPAGSTLQCGRWLWDDMPLNSPKRPPYWNSTSGFDFDQSPQSTCHSAPVCEILSKSDHPQKTVKNSKNDHWCTNRHMSTQSPPTTQSRANGATLRDLHHTCLGSGHSPSPVGKADCMCLHGRPCVWLPFAAVCCYTLFYLLMMPAARLVCQRPLSNFPYVRTPLANFLLSRPNKNTVILKRTRSSAIAERPRDAACH